MAYYFFFIFMRDTSGHSPLDVDFRAPIDSDQNSDVDQQPEEYEVTDLTEVPQTPPPLPNRARGRERQTPPPLPAAARRGIHAQPEDKVLFDDTEFSNQTQPKSLKQLAQEVSQTPPPIPEAARFRGVHSQPDNKVLFDETEFGNHTKQKSLKELASDEVLFDHTEFSKRTEPKSLQQLTNEGLRRSREEETEATILEAVNQHKLSPELKVQILQSRDMNNILDHLGDTPNAQEADAIIKEVAAELATKQRTKLERLGLRFHPDNTLILNEASKEAQSYENVRAGLENLHQLTEIAPPEIFATPKQGLERVEQSKETIADHVYTDLLNLGIDAGTVQNALSHDLLDELEHTNYMTGKTNVILDAIDKVVRKLENKGQFTLDLYGDPQPIGALNWLKNKLSFGRRADKQKSSREYQDIVALQTLRDAVAVGTSGAPIKYPAPESFADMAAKTAPVKTRKPLSQGRRLAAGIAGLTAAGTAASMYDDVQARDTREAAKVSVAEPVAEAAKPEAQDGEYQFPQFTIAPQRSEEGTSRTRRSADFTPARSAEAEVVSQARSIDESLDLKTTVKAPERVATKRNKAPKLDVFADHFSTPDAAKAPKQETKKVTAKTKAAKYVESVLPSAKLDAVLKKPIEAKKQPSERARAAKTKAEEIVVRVKAERAAKKVEATEPTSSLMPRVEEALTTKFGPDAERYLKALPSDVRTALGEMSPTQARALLADKIINIHEDPNITAERITALHAAKKALEEGGESVSKSK